MEVINKTLSEEIDRTQQKEVSTQQNDAPVTVEKAQELQPLEQNEPDEKVESIDQEPPKLLETTPKNKNLPPKRKNGKFISRGRFNRLANAFRKKLDDTDTSTTTQRVEPDEPPEQWTPSRLRQNGRDLVLNKIKTISQEILTLKNDKKLERLRIKRARIANANSHNSIFSEHHNSSGSSLFKVHKRYEETSAGTLKIEIGDSITEYSRQKEISTESPTHLEWPSQEESFDEFSIVKVEDELHQSTVTVEDELHQSTVTVDEELHPSDMNATIRPCKRKRKRNMYNSAHPAETPAQRYCRIERVRMAQLKRRVLETEDERAKRLEHLRTAQKRKYWIAKARKAAEMSQATQLTIEGENHKVDTEHHNISVTVEEGTRQPDMDVTLMPCKRTGKRNLRNRAHPAETARKNSWRMQRGKNKRANETEEEKRARYTESKKLAYIQRRLAETEEERLERLDRIRMARLKLREMETEEEKFSRLELLRAKRRTETEEQRSKRLKLYRIRYYKLKSLRGAGDCSNGVERKKTKKQRKKPSSAEILPIDSGNSTSQYSMFEEILTESPTCDTQSIRKEAKSDAVCNLIDFICRSHHSHHPQHRQQLQIFDKLCSSRSSLDILSAVAWHKLNCPAD